MRMPLIAVWMPAKPKTWRGCGVSRTRGRHFSNNDPSNQPLTLPSAPGVPFLIPLAGGWPATTMKVPACWRAAATACCSSAMLNRGETVEPGPPREGGAADAYGGGGVPGMAEDSSTLLAARMGRCIRCGLIGDQPRRKPALRAWVDAAGCCCGGCDGVGA